MDPAAMMLLASLVSGGIGALTGKPGEQKSSFDSGQKEGLQGILDSIKGMKGGAQDITQQPQYQQGQDWLSSLFNDEDFFNKFEAPMQRQFQEQTVPDLANRFASMGSGGALGSTGFRNQLAREGSNLQTNIAAMRGGMQQQGVNQALQYAQQPFSNLMNMYQQALGQPVNNQYQPPSTGGWGSMAAPLMQGATSYWGGQGGQGGQQNQSSFQPQGMSRGYPGQSPSTY